MVRFEYEVTHHLAEQFRELVFTCGQGGGGCQPERTLEPDLDAFAALLNERGDVGWELVQALFGESKVIAIWKRALTS
jgi:hypothetical protein